MIPDFKTYIGESVWADIHKRSNGTQERKEDDVNLLDRIGLYDYIISHYDNMLEFPNVMVHGAANMNIPFKLNGEIQEMLICYGFGEIHCFFKLDTIKPLYNALCDKFKVSKLREDKFKKYHWVIEPDDSTELTNQFFIDVLDTFVEIDDTMLKKK